MKLRNFSIVSLVASAAVLALASVPAFADTKPTGATPVASAPECKCCAEMKKKMEAEMKRKMEAGMGKMSVIPVVPG